MQNEISIQYQYERAKQRQWLINWGNRINKGTRYAAAAYDRAKTIIRFKELESKGLVRIVRHPDDDMQLDDLLGDCYDPTVNTDIQPSRLDRERQAEIDRIEQEGVWWYEAQAWDYENGWEHVDSICGFVGDDFIGSDHDLDMMQACIAAAEHNKPVAQVAPHREIAVEHWEVSA